MTTGSGLAINANETNPRKQNTTLKQLIEGRSNAVGLAALATGAATTTTVTAVNCSPTSAVLIFPAAAASALVVTTTYVLPANVTASQFIISHAANSTASMNFWWAAFG
jgi:hypothetical protein